MNWASLAALEEGRRVASTEAGCGMNARLMPLLLSTFPTRSWVRMGQGLQLAPGQACAGSSRKPEGRPWINCNLPCLLSGEGRAIQGSAVDYWEEKAHALWTKGMTLGSGGYLGPRHFLHWTQLG